MTKVTVIPSTIDPLTQMPVNNKEKLKVAAYARVSTSSDEQYTSYEAQVNYYKEYIQGRLDWDYVTVYADEGITGTNTKFLITLLGQNMVMLLKVYYQVLTVVLAELQVVEHLLKEL